MPGFELIVRPAFNPAVGIFSVNSTMVQVSPQPQPSANLPAESPQTVKRELSIAKRTAHFLQLSKVALCLGAGLSIVDMISDVAMVKVYSTGHRKYAMATLILLCLNLFFQLMFVVVQNAKRGARVLLREVLFVLTFVKPGVDVYRVVTMQKNAANNMISAQNEMLIMKSVELTMECILGSDTVDGVYVRQSFHRCNILPSFKYSHSSFHLSVNRDREGCQYKRSKI